MTNEQMATAELLATRDAFVTTLNDIKKLISTRDERIAQLEAALRLTVDAMRHAVDVGCVDHLDCCDDAGAFWHTALDLGIAALGQEGRKG